MRQVFVIHGGTSVFSKYDDFLELLRTRTIDIEKSKGWRDWKGRLPESLGEEYEVISPRMPNRENARYLEWKIWFERHIPFMRDGVILVGHSLGSIFLAKYLSEENMPTSIRATFLVAAPYDVGGSGKWARDMGEFTLPPSLEKLAVQGGRIFLYHSTDDKVVQYEELAKYQKQLPDAATRTFTDRGHFHQEDFPEIVEDIQSLA